MLQLAVMLAFVALAAGTALGWYLRSATAWCPHCGHTLSCTSCGQRPTRRPMANVDRART